MLWFSLGLVFVLGLGMGFAIILLGHSLTVLRDIKKSADEHRNVSTSRVHIARRKKLTASRNMLADVGKTDRSQAQELEA